MCCKFSNKDAVSRRVDTICRDFLHPKKWPEKLVHGQKIKKKNKTGGAFIELGAFIREFTVQVFNFILPLSFCASFLMSLCESSCFSS